MGFPHSPSGLPPPQCSSGEGFPYHNHSLDSRTLQARGTEAGVECMDIVSQRAPNKHLDTRGGRTS